MDKFLEESFFGQKNPEDYNELETIYYEASANSAKKEKRFLKLLSDEQLAAYKDYKEAQDDFLYVSDFCVMKNSLNLGVDLMEEFTFTERKYLVEFLEDYNKNRDVVY